MKIGLSTAILWDYEELNVPGAISHAVDNLNFEAVEIHCEEPFFEGWGKDEAEETKREIKDVMSVLDVEVSLHAPYHDVNIATFNRGVAEEILRQYKECIETARYLDSEVVVIHPGFVSSRKYRRDRPLQNMIHHLKEITEFAQDSGVKICLENLSSKKKAMCVSISEIRKVLSGVNKENLKITLDIAHANTTSDGPIVYARELKDDIAHIHVSDNTGEDNHLPIGLGNIDFESVLEELEPYEGLLMVEGWIPTDEDPYLKYDRRELERIRNNLRK